MAARKQRFLSGCVYEWHLSRCRHLHRIYLSHSCRWDEGTSLSPLLRDGSEVLISFYMSNASKHRGMVAAETPGEREEALRLRRAQRDTARETARSIEKAYNHFWRGGKRTGYQRKERTAFPIDGVHCRGKKQPTLFSATVVHGVPLSASSCCFSLISCWRKLFHLLFLSFRMALAFLTTFSCLLTLALTTSVPCSDCSVFLSLGSARAPPAKADAAIVGVKASGDCGRELCICPSIM